MPPKLPLRAREIRRGLERLGFVQDHVRGSHVVYYNSLTGRRAVVPQHTGDLPKGTAKSIFREAGISLDQFLAE